MSDGPARSAPALGAICAAVLCILLSLGLWPFHAPLNQVTWLKGADGLSFGRYGTVVSSNALNLTDSNEETCCSIEILGTTASLPPLGHDVCVLRSGESLPASTVPVS